MPRTPSLRVLEQSTLFLLRVLDACVFLPAMHCKGIQCVVNVDNKIITSTTHVHHLTLIVNQSVDPTPTNPVT